MKTRLGNKSRFRAAAVSICMISFLTGACFLRRSLDSYEGTPTTLLPAKVGDFDRKGEYSPVLVDGYIPEAKSLVRSAGTAPYSRKNDAGSDAKFSYVNLSVYICFTPEQAKDFLKLNKEAALKEGDVVKEEAQRKRFLAGGEKLVLVPSSASESDPSRKKRVLWRNGTVVFVAWTTGSGKIEDVVDFEASHTY